MFALAVQSKVKSDLGAVRHAGGGVYSTIDAKPAFDNVVLDGLVIVERVAHGLGGLPAHDTLPPVSLTLSSFRSNATTGTRSNLPILMTGSSPRRAASYAALRPIPSHLP